MVEVFRVDFLSASNCQVPIFRAGQQVDAKCILQLKEPLKARAIQMSLVGKATVGWKITEVTTYRQGVHTVGQEREDFKYSSDFDYLNYKYTMWENAEQMLPIGLHQFPFSFAIPQNAPPNFSGELGHIHYYCTVVIDRPWKKDKEITHPFIVAPHIDLNQISWAQNRIEMQMEKRTGFLFNRGKIFAKLQIPQSGFVPGQEIPIQIDFENNSSSEVKKVKAKLLEKVTYTAKLHSYSSSSADIQQRFTSTKVAQFKEKFKVNGKTNGTFHGTFPIPTCALATIAESCPIIRVAYELEIKVEGPSTIAFGNIPILIGTIPLRSAQQMMPLPLPLPNAAINDA